MLKDLIKLADYLDQKQKREFVNQIDLLISKTATSPFWNDPESAPIAFKENPGEITGEWNTDEEDAFTEEFDPTQMVEQHKPTKEILDAIRKTLGDWNQHLLHIRWHIPGVSQDHLTDEDGDGSAYWAVTAASNDPAEVPQKNHWAFWEVSPGEFGYELGVELPGQETRLYGEG